jgi:hypothetical protein
LRRAGELKKEDKRALAILGVVLGAPFVYGFLTYGTIRPCEMARIEAKRAMIRAVANKHDATSALLGMRLMGNQAVDSMVEVVPVWRCVEMVIKAHTGALDEYMSLP